IWKQHAPALPAPDVDFSREMVVGVFLGSRNSAGYSVEIVSVEKDAGGLVVRYRESAPGRRTLSEQIITSPSHLVAVPKTDGAVRFEKIDN
ncbi:MAG TPA: protease complex subunit PrcB family protein, partial [Vicinamibacterales bacterium]|nr:protease complex subunit PrcB family protein [Vicinamibacterales bacterium]